mgnify:CR=1 FL=1
MATNVTEKDKTLNDVIEWCGEQVSGIEKKIPTASDADFLNGERCTLLAVAAYCGIGVCTGMHRNACTARSASWSRRRPKARRLPTSRRATHTVGRTQRDGGSMARIKETFDSRAWFMLECDDHNCEQRFDDSQWYAYEDDLLADAKDDGWQILYKDEHPELERDMHYCPAHRLPECSTCTNIMIDPAGWKDGQCPECIKEEIPNERS